MGVALSGMSEDDNEFYIYSVGPKKINEFTSEFCNLSERSLKARGKKIKFYKVSSEWMDENIQSFNYFAFFSLPKEPFSKLTSVAQLNNIELGIFRY